MLDTVKDMWRGGDRTYEIREQAVWEMSTYQNNTQICQTVRQYWKTFAMKKIPGIRDSRYVNKISIQVQCKNSRLTMEAIQLESARGRNSVAGTNIYSFCAINTHLHQARIRVIYHTFCR